MNTLCCTVYWLFTHGEDILLACFASGHVERSNLPRMDSACFSEYSFSGSVKHATANYPLHRVLVFHGKS